MFLLTRLTGEEYECTAESIRKRIGVSLPAMFRIQCVALREGGKSLAIEVGDFDKGVAAPGVIAEAAKELAHQIINLLGTSGIRNKDGMFVCLCNTCHGLAFGSIESQVFCTKGHRVALRHEIK